MTHMRNTRRRRVYRLPATRSLKCATRFAAGVFFLVAERFALQVILWGSSCRRKRLFFVVAVFATGESKWRSFFFVWRRRRTIFKTVFSFLDCSTVLLLLRYG